MKGNLISNSVVSYVNEIVEIGIRERASDIHISFDRTEGMEIRYRIDGTLREIELLYDRVDRRTLEKNIVEIISRIKILANMNVAEKRKPQDGSFSFLLTRRYNIRAAYVATVEGESVVLRILENYLEDTKLSTLGFSEENIQLLKRILLGNYGLVLVSGPTGSGKSTTLLSMINMLNDGKRKIISVEDPVETKIKGIIQIQVNEEIGVTFPEILRSTLRNDPDIIVVSEIRDEITAEIAVRAALTGHLVIATVHTNDAVSTISRLVDMKIPKYLVLDSLKAVIAQRLVGKKCKICLGKGCTLCSNGYKGRISINEILILNEEIKSILKKDEIGEKTKSKLREVGNHFSDFDKDIRKKLSEDLIFEKDVYEFMKADSYKQ